MMLGDVPIMNKFLIGSRIRTAREENNLTQEALAEKVGMSKNAISNIENGGVEAQFKNIILITKALNISIDYLVQDDVSDDEKIYLHEILVKLNSMQGWELKYINKYLMLWKEAHENDISKED